MFPSHYNLLISLSVHIFLQDPVSSFDLQVDDVTTAYSPFEETIGDFWRENMSDLAEANRKHWE
jgi:hypothetical protein